MVPEAKTKKGFTLAIRGFIFCCYLAFNLPWARKITEWWRSFGKNDGLNLWSVRTPLEIRWINDSVTIRGNWAVSNFSKHWGDVGLSLNNKPSRTTARYLISNAKPIFTPEKPWKPSYRPPKAWNWLCGYLVLPKLVPIYIWKPDSGGLDKSLSSNVPLIYLSHLKGWWKLLLLSLEFWSGGALLVLYTCA